MATMTEAGPTVRQSPNDARLYRSLRLPNGLNVLLIHDPEAAGQARAAPAAAGGGTKQEGDREEDLDSLVSGSGSSEGGEEEVRRPRGARPQGCWLGGWVGGWGGDAGCCC